MAETKQTFENNVVVLGTLKELEVTDIAEAGADKIPMKIATIKVETQEGEVHVAKLMAMETFKDKKDPSIRVENKKYKAIQTMQDEYISLKDIAEGKAPEDAKATVVRVVGSLELNIYKGQNGLTETPQISARFVSRVDNAESDTFGANFTIQAFLITSGQAVEDNEGNETGEYRFKAATVDYNGKAHVFEFTAEGAVGDYFADAERGLSVVLNGKYLNKYKITRVERVKENSFGEVVVDTKRDIDRRLLVIGGYGIDDEDDAQYITSATMKDSMAKYESFKKEKESEAPKEKKQTVGMTTKTSNSSASTANATISDDDLPF